MALSRAEAGRLGGLVLKEKNQDNENFFKELGAMGGRPRSLTIEDVLTAESELRREFQERIAKEDGHPRCSSLRTLKRLWRYKQHMVEC